MIPLLWRCTDKSTLLLAFFSAGKGGRLKLADNRDSDTVNMKTLLWSIKAVNHRSLPVWRTQRTVPHGAEHQILVSMGAWDGLGLPSAEESLGLWTQAPCLVLFSFSLRLLTPKANYITIVHVFQFYLPTTALSGVTNRPQVCRLSWGTYGRFAWVASRELNMTAILEGPVSH